VRDSTSWHTINRYSGGGNAKGDRNPTEENLRASKLAQNFEEKSPGQGVKSASEIEFNQHTWFFSAVDLPC
jgi:hypothetical protein